MTLPPWWPPPIAFSSAIIATGFIYDGFAYSGYGGAIDTIDDSTLTVSNSTFTDNAAHGQSSGSSSSIGYGGAIETDGSETTVTNSIIWNDSAQVGPEIYKFNSDLNVSYSDTADSSLEADGSNNISSDPMFVRGPQRPAWTASWGTSDVTYGILRLVDPALQQSMPAITPPVPAGVTTDIAGQSRIIDSADTSDTADAIMSTWAHTRNQSHFMSIL